MVIAITTAQQIAALLRDEVKPSTARKLLTALSMIPGNKSYRDSVVLIRKQYVALSRQ